ncbi:MAG TPA: CoA pyrophosphatase [Actinomycetota bacterium]|jgi:8-oxo-dGTP pyrophosphatase MutT (NUDIX family)|nr:CoA pyrophosphatase [Actinomycetota bacterium]
MDVDDLRAILAGSLAQDPRPQAPPGDRLAGVMVPILVGPEPAVVFTRRTAHLSRHAGEISFPGGLQDPGERHVLDTALRETSEELGIPPSAFDVLGALAPVHTTVSGILIVPFVGMLALRPTLTPNAEEIAEVLEFPVRRLIEAEAEVEVPRGDRIYRGFAYGMEGHTIWGATARILHQLIEILRRRSS